MSTQNININKKDSAEVEIEGEVTADAFEKHRAGALEKLGQNVEIPGFRKGKAPADMVESRVGEMPLLEEMAERAISETYPQILSEHNIQAIGRPSVQITKIAKGSPLGFKITTATMPEAELGDYKQAASEVMSKGDEEPVEVSDDEVENTIKQIRAQLAQQPSSAKATEGKQATNSVQDTNTEDPNQKADKASEAKEAPLTNEDVQKLGDFKSVEDFRAKVRENLKHEKQTKERQKKRMAIMDKIIAESDIKLPYVVIEGETDKLMQQFEHDVSRMGLKFDEYLKHVGKSREDMRKEWRPDAEKNAKVQLILSKIAKTENITPDEERVKEEINKLMEHYKDSNVSESRAREYVNMILTNEAVFEFLEKQGA